MHNKMPCSITDGPQYDDEPLDQIEPSYDEVRQQEIDAETPIEFYRIPTQTIAELVVALDVLERLGKELDEILVPQSLGIES